MKIKQMNPNDVFDYPEVKTRENSPILIETAAGQFWVNENEDGSLDFSSREGGLAIIPRFSNSVTIKVVRLV